MKRDPKTDTPNFFNFARDYLHIYLPTVQRRSAKTIEAYRISLECFLEFLADHERIERAQVSFDHFDRQHLKSWLAWMSDQRHYAPKTIALRLSALKAFLTYCSYEDLTLVAVSQASKALRTPASPKKPIEYLTPDETRAVLAAFDGRSAKSRRNRMLLILLYDTAARVGEITELTLQGLCLADPGHVTLTGKGDKTRIVPLTAKTIEHLEVYLDEFHPHAATLPVIRPLFYSHHHGHPSRLSTDSVAAVLKQASLTARSAYPTIPENIHCHMLRKTKAMDLYQQGVPMPIIMRLLGHENMSTTAAFYAFATIDMMRQAVNAATPGIDHTSVHALSPAKLQALYSLR
jgi:site-specific recombinase XerD